MKSIIISISTTILFCMLANLVVAQSPAFADSVYQAGNFDLALDAYKKLSDKKSKEQFTYLFKAGVSAYHIHNKELALQYLHKTTTTHPISNFYLAEMNFENYRFDDAVTYYSHFLAHTQPDSVLIEQAKKKLKQAELGSRFLRRVEEVEITDSLVVDKSIFLKSFSVPSDLGTVTQNVFFVDGKQTDIISHTTQRGDRTYFSEIDSGNTNLYTVDKLLNKWSEKRALDDINSSNNENYPFLMLDGITLYFAADGEQSLGGYDIFMTRMKPEDKTFFPPENVGMPFNSPFNDYMMMIDELNKVGWFVSDRYQKPGKVVIYQFVPTLEKEMVRTENIDSLIAIAQLKALPEFKGNNRKIQQHQQRDNRNQLQSVKSIFISNSVIYSDAGDFKSNEARNHYFQSSKLQNELKSVDLELKKLRTNYFYAKKELKQQLAYKILNLEQRQKELMPLIKAHEKKMRNKELKRL